VQFFGFHLMPYPYLSDEHQGSRDSSWVTLSNRNFDPRRGHELYQRYLSESGSASTSTISPRTA
jgi:hypothetical protein